MCLAELSWLVNGIKSEIVCINVGSTETGYIIPEKIDNTVLIIKFTGSACLKNRTKERPKNDSPKKGIIITNNKKNTISIDEKENEWFPSNWSKNI